jgi:hypothetical protein
MKWLSIIALASCFTLGGLTARAADEKKASKLDGTYSKSAGGMDVTFEFKGDKVGVVLVNGSGDGVGVDATFTIDEKGLLKGTVEKSEKKGNGAGDGPPKGDKFSFKVVVTKDGIKISDLESNGGEEVKQLVEGDYKKVTKK